MTLHWLGLLAFVPGTFNDPVGLASRLNYPALAGIGALGGGAVYALNHVAQGSLRHLFRALAILLMAGGVFFGVRLHLRVVSAHVEDWRLTKLILEQIGELCPSIEQRTLVVLDSGWPTELLRADAIGKIGMSHQVISSLLIARYDDPSLRGVRKRELVVTPEGAFPLHFGGELRWFREGEYGPLAATATGLDGPVDFSRLLILGWGESGDLRVLPEISMPAGKRQWTQLQGHAERCGSTPVTPSEAFCHAFTAACRGVL